MTHYRSHGTVNVTALQRVGMQCSTVLLLPESWQPTGDILNKIQFLRLELDTVDWLLAIVDRVGKLQHSPAGIIEHKPAVPTHAFPRQLFVVTAPSGSGKRH